MHSWLLNSGERIPRRLCGGVSEQRNKEVLDGVGFLAGSAARNFNPGIAPVPDVAPCFVSTGPTARVAENLFAET